MWNAAVGVIGGETKKAASSRERPWVVAPVATYFGGPKSSCGISICGRSIWILDGSTVVVTPL